MNNNTVKMQTSRFERISYSMYFFGQNIFYTIIATYVATYLLNMGMSEATAAVVLIAPQLWDIANDIMFGVIVDKAKLKSGKFLPWIRISWILTPLATILIFFMPAGLSEVSQCAWIIISYSIWSVAYTMCDTPIFALSTAMSEYISERTSILSIGRVFGTMGAIVATLGIEAIYMPLGWRMTAIVVSALCMICMFPLLILAKERTHVENKTGTSVKTMFSSLFKNKYLLVFYISFFLIGFANSVQIVIPIFAQYVLGNTEKGTVLLAAALLPAIITAFFIPKLCRKIDKFYIYIATIILFAVASILHYFVGYENEIMLNIGMAIRGVGLVGNSVLAYLFTPDCIEYGHYKNGIRQEGVSFALQTFVTKLSGAVNNSSAMAVLAALGFAAADADAITGMVSAEAGNACWTVFTLFSAIGPAIAVPILLIGYKLRDKDVRLMMQLNNGEISRSECDSKLSRNY